MLQFKIMAKRLLDKGFIPRASLKMFIGASTYLESLGTVLNSVGFSFSIP